ncbi:MAG: branched-chain amino acid ABC transporter permease [Acidobacteriota bacterium]
MRFVFETRYRDSLRLFRRPGQRFWFVLLAVALLTAPAWLDTFYVGELTWVFIYAIAGIGLMLLVGYTGLVSLGHAAFLAIGAYTHTILLDHGWPWPLAVLAAVGLSAITGYAVGRPTLRMTGIYLAIATLAFAEVVTQLISHWESLTGGFRGLPVPRAVVFGVDIGRSVPFYFVCLGLLVVGLWLARNLLLGPTGRAMNAVRDSEISAKSMGIDLAQVRSVAFALSAGFTGLAGALYAHQIGYLAPDAFTLLLSIQLLLMVVVGGLGSLHGVVLGAIFLGLLPQLIALVRDELPTAVARMPGLEPGLFGLVLVLFLIYEPLGLHGRWRKLRQFFEEFPLYRRHTHKRQRRYLRTGRLR